LILRGGGKCSLSKIAIAASVLAASALAVAVSAPGQAANLLQNGSFENTAGTFVNNGLGFMLLNPSSTAIPGWTTTGSTLPWVNNVNVDGLATPFGSFLIDVAGIQNPLTFAGVTQTINTTVGQQYTLSLSLGTINPTGPGPISVTATAGSSSQTFTSNPSGSGNQWENFSFDFTTTSTSTPISIVGISAANGAYIGLDNVSVEVKNVETVPEPSSIPGILGLGILGIGTALKRKS
jgi:Protein of unknown function (DUF642)/PEP-CTERM motif